MSEVTAEVISIAQVGRLDVQLALTDHPWQLPVSTIVIPVGRGPEFDFEGGFAVSFRSACAEDWPRVESAIARTVTQRKAINAANPLIVPVSGIRNAPKIQKIILATAYDGHGAVRPDIAAAAVLKLANRNKIESLVLPLLGSGRIGTPPIDTAKAILEAIKRVNTAGSLTTLILATLSPEAREWLLENSISKMSALEWLYAETAELGLTASSALRTLFELAGRLAPQRADDNKSLTTSLLLFAAVELGNREGDDDWHFLTRFSGAILDMAGNKYKIVERQYFGGEPRFSIIGKEPVIKFLSANTRALLRKAAEFSTLQGILGADACLLALLQMEEANALNNLRRMGVDTIEVRKRLTAPQPRPEPPPAPESNTQFIADDAELDYDELGRGALAVALARRLHKIWCVLNGATPPNSSGARSLSAAAATQVDSATWTGVGDADKSCFFDRGRKETLGAFVMHLDAPWGGGKTTFANFLARVLNPYGYDHGATRFLRERYGDANLSTVFLQDPIPGESAPERSPDWPEDARRPWIIVPFNAWQVEHCSPPWWLFYQAIRRHCVASILCEGNNAIDTSATALSEKPRFGERAWHWLTLWAHEFLWRLRNPKIMTLLATAFVSLLIFWLLYHFGVVQLSSNPDDKAPKNSVLI